MTTMSQDEINAMLAKVDNITAEEPDASAVASAATVENDARESHFSSSGAEKLAHSPLPESDFSIDDPAWQLTPEEVDVLGEMGNMCMGAVATTMYTLLDRKCSITTPKVSIHTTQEVLSAYPTPFVVVEVEYIEGIDGKNLLLLKELDAAMITDLLMGGDGNVKEPIELNELHMSAISEIMNQMIGASATAMSKMLGMTVNISPPQSARVEQYADMGDYLDRNDVVVKISFDMEIEGLLSSQLLQLVPFTLSRNLVQKVKAVGGVESLASDTNPKAQAAPAPQQPAPQHTAPQPAYAYTQPAAQQPYHDPAMAQAAAAYTQPPAPQPGNLVDVRPMHYSSFDPGASHVAPTQQGMELIHDIPLQVSVELGRSKKDISEILEFGLGTVIVLDKVAGDPVEVLVNGKLIAKGEVVVIDENYGVRITDVMNG